MNAPKIDITLDGVTYDNTLSQDIAIDRSNLEEEIATHAEKYHYYSSLSQIAKYKAAVKKFELEQLYARIDFEKRNAAGALASLPNAKVKYTEKMCENEVLTDPRYTEAYKEYLKVNLLAGQLEECAKSLAHRRDMLIQLGGITKQTLQPQRVVDQQVTAVREMMSATKRVQPSLAPFTPPPSMPPSVEVTPVEPSVTCSEFNGGLGAIVADPVIPIITSTTQTEPTPPRRRRRQTEIPTVE